MNVAGRLSPRDRRLLPHYCYFKLSGLLREIPTRIHAPPPMSREVAQQCLASRGEERLGVKLHAFDAKLAMAQTHDFVVPGLRGYLEARRSEERRVGKECRS